jgi:hypothetical protein
MLLRASLLACAAGLAGALPRPAVAQSLETCLDSAADYSPVYPTATYPVGTKEVIAVWRFAKGEKHRELLGRFVAVDVGSAAPPNYKIAEAKMAVGKTSEGRFRFTLPRPMPAGHYVVEVSADGQPWQSAVFDIAPRPDTPAPGRLEDLAPLAEGRAWHYDFVQEAGEGAHVTLPDVKPDAEGKLRATGTYTVAGVDPIGTRIAIRRNATPVLDEWWRLASDGLFVTQRKEHASGDTVTLDPPQKILAWPPGDTEWGWEAKDKSEKQSYRMWGPLPVETPSGKLPGYIVLLRNTQANGMEISVERQFVAGMGMTREVTIFQLGSVTAMRQSSVLRSADKKQ